MDKNIIISVTKSGKKVEQLSRERLESDNLVERNNILESKILNWYAQTKDAKFAEFMGITVACEGRL